MFLTKEIICFIPAATCFDSVLNEDETAVDCGGVCVGVRSCTTGDSCTTALDCISNVCTGNICQGELIYSGIQLFLVQSICVEGTIIVCILFCDMLKLVVVILYGKFETFNSILRCPFKVQNMCSIGVLMFILIATMLLLVMI